MVINTPAACLQIKTHSVVTHGTISYIPKKEKSANETMKGKKNEGPFIPRDQL